MCAAEKNKGSSTENNILAWVWCTCKLLYNYFQFILHDQLVSQVLHNGGGERGGGGGGNPFCCHKFVHMWCVPLQS